MTRDFRRNQKDKTLDEVFNAECKESDRQRGKPKNSAQFRKKDESGNERKPDKKDSVAKLNQKTRDRAVESFGKENLKNDAKAEDQWFKIVKDIRHTPKKDLKAKQQLMDIVYIVRLDNATRIERGTQLKELDNALIGKTLGYKSPNPNYTYLTTSHKVAESFALQDVEDGHLGYKGQEAENDEDVPVVFSIPKEKIIDKLVSPGYTTDYEERIEESDIHEPQGYRHLPEEEHRAVPNTIPIQDLDMTITIYTRDPERQRRFREKYKTLGKVVFA